MSTRSSAQFRLSVVIVVLAGVVSAVSLAFPAVYRDQSEWFRTIWLTNDLVTLVVAVPLLVIALALAARGSRRAELLWYGGIGYLLYNYAYYLFGARINALFPAYVLLWVGALFVLILALGRFDAGRLAEEFMPLRRERVVAGYMLFTGIGLSIAWLAQWAGIVFKGASSNLGEAGFQLVAAMDLSFMVPYFLLGGVLLLRRKPWGYVVGPVIMTQGALYTLVLAATSGRMALAGAVGGGELPVWAGWTAVGVAALVLLLSGLRRQTAAG